VDRLEVIPDAAGIGDRDGHDGYDARRTIPPLLRPGVATDPATCRIWERHVLDVLGSDAFTAEQALAAIAFAADRIRAWSAGGTTLAEHASRVAADGLGTHAEACRLAMPLANALRLFAAAAASVPEGLKRPAAPDGAAADLAWVQPGWTAHARPVRRYLAARAFAAWSAYLGEGLRTQAAMLAVALAAVRVEAVRETARASKPLDEPLLHAAIRSADLLLHHLSDTAALVAGLASVERGTLPDTLAFMGLETAA
jgi:hypothetical protein